MTNSLQVLAAAEEIEVGFVRPDGAKGPTPIWDVEVEEQIYVRSAGGASGGWYRRLRANPDGEVWQGGRVYPVRSEPVHDAEFPVKVTNAYLVKYHGSSLPRMFSTPRRSSCRDQFCGDEAMAPLELPRDAAAIKLRGGGGGDRPVPCSRCPRVLGQDVGRRRLAA